MTSVQIPVPDLASYWPAIVAAVVAALGSVGVVSWKQSPGFRRRVRPTASRVGWFLASFGMVYAYGVGCVGGLCWLINVYYPAWRAAAATGDMVPFWYPLSCVVLATGMMMFSLIGTALAKDYIERRP